MMDIAAHPTYDVYKDSGEGWIEDVPAHWETRKLKHLFQEKKHKANLDLNCGSISFGEVVEKDDERVPLATKASYQEVSKGEFLVNPLNLNYDLKSLRIGLSDIDVVVSAGYLVLQAKDEMDKRYFKYLLHRYDVAYMKLLGSGVRQTISFNHIANSILVAPPLPEQRAIAAFLDDKCAKIDGAVKIKEDQIALLRERRQIIIQDAVTRGLNPAAPMKDSGIDWIGQIPAHWDLLPLKRMFFEKNERTKTGTEVLLSLRMNDGLVPHDDVSDKPLGPDDLKEYKKVAIGQLVMNRMRASIGIFGLADADGIVSPDYAIFDMKAGLNGQFFLHLFKTGLMGQQFRVSSRGLGTGSSGFMRLYTDDFGAISVAVPPSSEQSEIVAYIQDKSAQINEAVAIKERQIAALKEYKTSLINAAVTGKIKVI